MQIALDISPLTGENSMQHRVRGVGFYTENLKKALADYFPENNYIFLSKEGRLKQEIDLIHYPYFEPFFLSLPLLKKVPTVVTVHDLTPLVFPKYFPAGLKGNIRWNIQKLALKTSQAILTDSEASKRDIIKFVGISPSKISIVYLAAGEEFRVLAKKECDSIRQKYNLPEKFCLYVGDVTWNKNLPRLIRTFQKIKLPLVMVGKALLESNFDKTNPWNQDRLLAQSLSEGERNILRVGFVPNSDLVAIYNAATVSVMPSLYEGFGLPILESMSCGTPVVTTKSGSIPEVAGDAAYYVDAYSEESISEGVLKVFKSKALQESLSQKGLSQAKKFSWEKTAQETIEVYKCVLGVM